MGETLPAHKLGSIVEHIAKKFREECEKVDTLKDLIGAKILSRELINPWMNANALPKTQAAFVEMMKSGDEEKEKINNNLLLDKKARREILYERVDTKMSMQNGKKLFEFNESQLFSAVESAIKRVFGNAKWADAQFKRKLRCGHSGGVHLRGWLYLWFHLWCLNCEGA